MPTAKQKKEYQVLHLLLNRTTEWADQLNAAADEGWAYLDGTEAQNYFVVILERAV